LEEELGIIAVDENFSDRRSFHLKLTELGRNKLSVARSDMAVMQDKIARMYPPETLQGLNEFAGKMLQSKGGSETES
jgi:DNA-binding MarR family transcriptional regulator